MIAINIIFDKFIIIVEMHRKDLLYRNFLNFFKTFLKSKSEFSTYSQTETLSGPLGPFRTTGGPEMAAGGVLRTRGPERVPEGPNSEKKNRETKCL